ncbi:MAG: hypothetical protein K2W95_27550 [Candidatus Obscuribacterales bacterium]|nr:hypothetical protein [Candidatus Obscuribacterales bacterium]
MTTQFCDELHSIAAASFFDTFRHTPHDLKELFVAAQHARTTLRTNTAPPSRGGSTSNFASTNKISDGTQSRCKTNRKEKLVGEKNGLPKIRVTESAALHWFLTVASADDDD